ncbi:hypothetical protein [Streptomyces sp. NBC_00648]|uniref:hypothetical protein n=1 Tax=Streptomyces sp. NBC_00648 TaxID=2975797 RepID=UPI003248E8F7
MSETNRSHVRRPRRKPRMVAAGVLATTAVLGIASVSFGGEVLGTKNDTTASRSDCPKPGGSPGRPSLPVQPGAAPAGRPDANEKGGSSGQPDTAPGAGKPAEGEPSASGPDAGKPVGEPVGEPPSAEASAQADAGADAGADTDPGTGPNAEASGSQASAQADTDPGTEPSAEASGPGASAQADRDPGTGPSARADTESDPAVDGESNTQESASEFGAGSGPGAGAEAGAEAEEPEASAGQPEGTCGQPAGSNRQGRGTWTEGPGAPSRVNPGARFSPELYQEIAHLKNKDFIKLRNRVIGSAKTDDATKQLKRSFYGDGCSYPFMKGLGNWVSWQSTVDACLQHDFRYTVGPNTLTEASQKDKDRSAADLQLGINIQEGGHFDSIPNGNLFYLGVSNFGRDHYVTQPGTTGGKTIGSMADLNTIVQRSSS